MRIKLFSHPLHQDSLFKFLSYFSLLFYPFNNSISNNILFGKLNPPIFVIISLVFFLLTEKEFKKKHLVATVPIFVSLLLLFFNNQYILNGDQLSTFLALFSYFVASLVIFGNNLDIDILFKVIKIYSIEHIIGTFIPIILPTFYANTVLLFMCRGAQAQCIAIQNFLTGSNPGLTTHYSTNGIYMAITCLAFFSSYISSKRKGDLFFTILSIFLLFIIGKRAHLVFTIISIIIAYLFKKSPSTSKRKNHKLVKVLSVIVIGSAFYLALAETIPALSSTVDRLLDQTDVLNGREPLYALALKGWNASPVIGNGWGSYVLKSHEVFGTATYGVGHMHAHNDFLEILHDTGIIGLSLYLILLLYILKCAFVAIHKHTPSKGSIFTFSYLVFYFLYSFTGTPISIVSTVVFFIISICILFHNNQLPIITPQRSQA